jgi:hypothetical protein
VSDDAPVAEGLPAHSPTFCNDRLANEAAIARERLQRLLAKYGFTWNDLPDLLAADDSDAPRSTSNNSKPAAPQGVPNINVLDLVARLVELYVELTPEQRMAVALWVLHTYVHQCFTITPRLGLISPVRGCGKTTLLALLDLLAADPYRTDNVSAASIYNLLDRQPYTLLIDEGDNLGVLSNSVLRAVFNSGHRRGGTISRFVGGRPRRFPTFAPLAVAAIGLIPLPLLHRSVVIKLQRASGRVERLDDASPVFSKVREEIQKWASTCSLSLDPEMPPALRNRAADNWRVLLAIADDLGHGEEAREAAVALCSKRPDEDAGVALLTDIRTVFWGLGTDRIASITLVEALIDLGDGLWADWRGLQDDRPPRKLNQAELARLLRPFEIWPRTVWPAQRRLASGSRRGYLRSQFEAAWHAYCPAADTPTHPSKIIRLPRA